MELFLENCLTTSPIISHSRQINPVWTDEDSGLGMEMDCASPKLSQKTLGNDNKNHSGKRRFDDTEQLPSKKSFKRHKSFDICKERFSVDDAVGVECDIDDGQRIPTSLPTLQGKHRDLKSISADTMREVLSGNHADTIGHVTIIDCRYPYEYQGGHIQNAINIYTKDGIEGEPT